MTTVAFIAEFNPPHKGHAYFIREIRRTFGEDTAVIALMSGAYVQRGTPAVLDAYARAEMALEIGADLVLELPFPFSVGTAERYATAGVRIINALACVDYLCFGSESGSLTELQSIADYLCTPAFNEEMKTLRKKDKSRGYAELRGDLLTQHISPDAAATALQPNNILAIEYLRALKKTASPVKPYTVKRLGDYHNEEDAASELPSSSLIRSFISRQNNCFDNLMEGRTADMLRVAIQQGHCPANIEKLSPALFVTLLGARYSPAPLLPPDCDRSLFERIVSAAPSVTTVSALIEAVRTKHYTDAHIRRVLLYLLFHVSASKADEAPAYTRLLSANGIGCRLARAITANGSIPILTKTADYKKLPTENAKLQSELAIFADQVYNLCIPLPRKASDALRRAPFIKK